MDKDKYIPRHPSARNIGGLSIHINLFSPRNGVSITLVASPVVLTYQQLYLAALAAVGGCDSGCISHNQQYQSTKFPK